MQTRKQHNTVRAAVVYCNNNAIILQYTHASYGRAAAHKVQWKKDRKKGRKGEKKKKIVVLKYSGRKIIIFIIRCIISRYRESKGNILYCGAPILPQGLGLKITAPRAARRNAFFYASGRGTHNNKNNIQGARANRFSQYFLRYTSVYRMWIRIIRFTLNWKRR